MFVLRSEQTISPGKTADYLVYQASSMEAVQQQPGFLWDIRMIYLGNYARRLIYQAWESREARLNYSRGSAWVRAPQHLLAGPALSEFYDILAETQDASLAAGHCAVDRHFRVSNGCQQEFEALEAGLSDLAKGQEGFVARHSLKFSGNDTSYMRVSIWESWADLEQWIATPAYAGENDAILSRVVWTSADRYEIEAVASNVPEREALDRLNWEALIPR